MVKNKKGWIKVVEAVIAIVALIGILTIIIQAQRLNVQRTTIYEEKSLEILKGVQMNESLRNEVILENTLPINSTDINFPPLLNNYLNEVNLQTANCTLMICSVNDSCIVDSSQKEIYTKDVIITATKDNYNPKKLKIFCIKK
jgi:membrane protein YdbS with pleckstrin-like domain